MNGSRRSARGAVYASFGKRALDLAAAGTALLLLSPLLIAVATAVALKLGRPVLFKQDRTGLRQRRFQIYKFRSMLDARDANGQPLPDEARLTSFGNRLRALSLDELPALLNVVRGDMSLVGPRPLLHHYLERYDREQLRRFEVRPGLTGWAIVNGRNAISWEEKFAFDVWYVDHLSFALDIRILLRTIARVIARKDVNAEGHATMPEFMGSGQGQSDR